MNQIKQPLTFAISYPVKDPVLIEFFLNLFRLRGWTEKEFDEEQVYDWCNKPANSKIKRIDLAHYLIFHCKFEFFRHFYPMDGLPETYAIKNGTWFSSKPTPKDTIYFLKEPKADATKGINIFNDLDTIEQKTREDPNDFFIVQPAIKNPLLLDKKKFDIRIYCALVTNDSINSVLRVYKHGYIKLCEEQYDAKSDNPYAQMSNINSDNSNLDSRRINFDPSFELYETLFPKIIKIIQNIFNVAMPHFANVTGDQVVWATAWDFIFDENHNPYLIEINNSPAYVLQEAWANFHTSLLISTIEPLAMHGYILGHDNIIDISYQQKEK